MGNRGIPEFRANLSEDLVLHVSCAGGSDRVFAAWSDGRRLKEWIGGEEFFVAPAFRNLRRGGDWSVRVRSLRRRMRTWFGGVVYEHDAPSRLSFSIASEDLVDIAAPSIVTVTFNDKGDTTQVEVRQRGFHSESERRAYRAIWTSALQALQEYIAENPVRDRSLLAMCRAVLHAVTGRGFGGDRALG